MLINFNDYSKKKTKMAESSNENSCWESNTAYHHHQITKGSAFKYFLNKMNPKERKFNGSAKASNSLKYNRRNRKSKDNLSIGSIGYADCGISNLRLKSQTMHNSLRPQTGKANKLRPFSAFQS